MVLGAEQAEIKVSVWLLSGEGPLPGSQLVFLTVSSDGRNSLVVSLEPLLWGSDPIHEGSTIMA